MFDQIYATKADAFEAGKVAGRADAEGYLMAQLAAIKCELNDMALIGVKPMWGSLISRLEQLIADAKTRRQQ